VSVYRPAPGKQRPFAMRRLYADILQAVAVFPGVVLAACALAIAAVHCVSPQTAPVDAAQQADVAAYAAEEQACVATNATRAYADECIAAVKQRWCGPGGQLALIDACGDSGLAGVPLAAPAAKDGGSDR